MFITILKLILSDALNIFFNNSVNKKNIFFENYFTGALGHSSLNGVFFSNGVTWSKSDIAAKAIEGSAYSQTMVAFDTGGTLSGMGGE